MSHGIFEHPHWHLGRLSNVAASVLLRPCALCARYPGLSSDSDFSDFQVRLHASLRQRTCVCAGMMKVEGAAAFVAAKWLPAALQGNPAGNAVL